jgi:hypothetical protein
VGTGSTDYHGSILPEAHSNFDAGYKVVTFYADPDSLLKTAYVLRKDGWRDSLNLYQRMISKPKIESIRRYLKTQKRVFINNIIVTLPSDVKPLSENLKTNRRGYAKRYGTSYCQIAGQAKFRWFDRWPTSRFRLP